MMRHRSLAISLTSAAVALPWSRSRLLRPAPTTLILLSAPEGALLVNGADGAVITTNELRGRSPALCACCCRRRVMFASGTMGSKRSSDTGGSLRRICTRDSSHCCARRAFHRASLSSRMRCAPGCRSNSEASTMVVARQLGGWASPTPAPWSAVVATPACAASSEADSYGCSRAPSAGRVPEDRRLTGRWMDGIMRRGLPLTKRLSGLSPGERRILRENEGPCFDPSLRLSDGDLGEFFGPAAAKPGLGNSPPPCGLALANLGI